MGRSYIGIRCPHSLRRHTKITPTAPPTTFCRQEDRLAPPSRQPATLLCRRACRLEDSNVSGQDLAGPPMSSDGIYTENAYRQARQHHIILRSVGMPLRLSVTPTAACSLPGVPILQRALVSSRLRGHTSKFGKLTSTHAVLALHFIAQVVGKRN